MRIQELDTLLANQIAAGEVIERPASVVKELVENAMDAASTEIEVGVESGGEKLIRVKDNGKGVHPEDLPLALMRHATSKIASYDDLVSVSTLGFRGEALASIAAVSRLKLTSMHAGQDSGFLVQTDSAGGLISPRPAAHPVGTTVEVADLFYQTPARKKFLKKERTEFNHIETMIHRLALGHFGVGFKLSHNNKEVLNTRPCHSQEAKEARVSTILGKSFLSNAFYINIDDRSIKLSGWVAEPTFTRSQPDMQYFYVNGRFVKDRLVTHAIKETFRDVLFNGRHPAYVLYFEIDATEVDVNVHPTKNEIRFRDGQTVYGFIRKSISEVLNSIRPNQKLFNKNEIASQAPHQSNAVLLNGSDHSENTQTFLTQTNQTKRSIPGEAMQQIDNYNQLHHCTGAVYTAPIQIPLAAIRDDEAQLKSPLGVAIGQLFDTFILAQNETGFVIVDMHAAHERILYEQLKQQQAQSNPASQQLLVPVSVTVSESNPEGLFAIIDDLNSVGFEISSLGPNKVVIRAIPVLLKKIDPHQFILDLLSDIQLLPSSTRLKQEVNKVLSSVSCHAALRAPHKLTISEMNTILRQMEKTQNSGCCNHGRPTWKQFSKAEVDRFFLRGQ